MAKKNKSTYNGSTQGYVKVRNIPNMLLPQGKVDKSFKRDNFVEGSPFVGTIKN